MRLLLIDQFPQIGGAQRCVLDLLPAFHARGWPVDALIPTGDVYAAELRSAGATVTHIECGPFTSGEKTRADAARFALQLPAQVRAIRSAAAQAELIYVVAPRLLPALALARIGKPVVFHAHSIVTQAAAARLMRRTLRSLHPTLLACARTVAASLPGPAQVIYNGVPSHPVRPAGPIREVAVIGRISPEKGQLDFVRAARIVVESGATVRFRVIGSPLFSPSSPYYDAVRAEAAGLPVEFVPWVDSIADVLPSCDLIVLPSADIDATPRIVLEAFSAAVPVVSYRSGGIPELIDDGRTGIFAKERSPAALAAAMTNAINQPGQVNAIARAGYLRWMESFQVERYGSEVCAVFEDVFERDHHDRPRTIAGASVRP